MIPSRPSYHAAEIHVGFVGRSALRLRRLHDAVMSGAVAKTHELHCWQAVQCHVAAYHCLHSGNATDVVIVDVNGMPEEWLRFVLRMRLARPDITVLGIVPHQSITRDMALKSSGLTCQYGAVWLWDSENLEDMLKRIIKNSPRLRSALECRGETVRRAGSVKPCLRVIDAAEQARHFPTRRPRLFSLHGQPDQSATHQPDPETGWEAAATLDLQEMNRRLDIVDLRDIRLRTVHLTEQEHAVVSSGFANLSAQQTALRLGISTGTVFTHRHNIITKLNAENWEDALNTCGVRRSA